jgi:hypothetical protein
MRVIVWHLLYLDDSSRACIRCSDTAASPHQAVLPGSLYHGSGIDALPGLRRAPIQSLSKANKWLALFSPDVQHCGEIVFQPRHPRRIDVEYLD